MVEALYAMGKSCLGLACRELADYGLQFILNDGTFYREIGIGGRGGATTDRKWLPFAPLDTASQVTFGPKKDPNILQLDCLIAKIMDSQDTDRVYLHAFFDMINQPIATGDT